MLQRFVRSSLHWVSAAFAGTLIIAAALLWRLSVGPLYLDFLTPYVAQALSENRDPYQFTIDHTVLVWEGWDRALKVRIVGMVVSGDDGIPIAKAPNLTVGLSVPALLRGVIAPTSVEFTAPDLTIVRHEDGRFGMEATQLGPDQQNFVEPFLADIARPPDRETGTGYLRQVNVSHGSILLDDRMLGLQWRTSAANLGFRRDGDGIRASLEFDLALGEQTTHFDVRGVFDGGAQAVDLTVEFNGLEMASFAAASESLGAQLAGLQIPISGSLATRVDFDGQMSDLRFDLAAVEGTVSLKGLLENDIPITYAKLAGVLSHDLVRLHLDDFFLDLEGTTIAAGGLVEGLDDSPSIVADITINDLPFDDLGQYWPAWLSTDAREWIVAHLSVGIFRSVQVSLNLDESDLAQDTLPDEAIRISAVMEDVTVDYLPPLPVVVGVDGNMQLTGTRLEIEMSGGRLNGLAVQAATFAVGGLGREDAATADLTITGPIEDAVELLAHPYLEFAQAVGLDPAKVTGKSATRLRLDFPLINDLELSQLSVAARAHLQDAKVKEAFANYDIGAGQLSLVLDNDGMDVSGPLVLNDVPMSVNWRANFGDEPAVANIYTAKARLTEEDRSRFDLPGEAYLHGSVDAELAIVQRVDGSESWRVAADLIDAELTIPGLEWKKKVGRSGTASVEVNLTPGEPATFEGISVAADGLAVSGRAVLEPLDWDVKELTLDRLEFAGNRISDLKMVSGPSGYLLDVKCEFLDLQPYLEEWSRVSGTTFPPMRLRAVADQVLVENGESMNAVQAEVIVDSDRWRSATLSGNLPGGKELSLRLAEGEDRRTLSIDSPDAGAALRAFGIFDNVVGGTLTVKMLLDEPKDPELIRGAIRVRDFTLVRAPNFAKILSRASLTGIYNALSGEGGKGIKFTNFFAPFAKRNNVIHLKDVRMYGPAVGVTLEGQYDLANDSAEVEGTLVPEYTLNSALGKVPVVGEIFVGEEGGGLFAATYAVSGPLESPKIAVNPLAALAPGILRALMSARTDEDGVLLEVDKTIGPR